MITNNLLIDGSWSYMTEIPQPLYIGGIRIFDEPGIGLPRYHEIKKSPFRLSDFGYVVLEQIFKDKYDGERI